MLRRIILSAFVLLPFGIAACSESGPEPPVAPAVPSPARVVSVTVTGPSSFFERGQTHQLTATATLSNGFVENRSASATWQSDNTGVATVSSAGVVTAGNEGEATISATVGEQRGTHRVRVRHGFRAPDPAPGQRIPPPDAFDIVLHVFQQRPDLVARSCQEAGGTWELMDEIVDRLRDRDLRWGYNGDRGNASVPSEDKVAYHYGAGPSENSRDAYAWDIIIGHCGPNPQPSWQDVSGLGTVWLTRGRF
jgi:hypothetical protein